jgi:hypothetical protein
VVIEEGLEVPEGFGLEDRDSCLSEPLESRSGTVEAFSHLLDDGTKGSENVETKTHRFEPCVIPRRAQQGEQSVELYQELFAGLREGVVAIKFAENRLPISDGLQVARRGGEHPLEESSVGSESLAIDLDGEV